MALFSHIIDQIAAKAQVTNYMSLGLYGDALLDPLVVERTRYVKEKLPGVILHVNTNAAAYSAAKHKALYEYVHVIAIHTESNRPEVYNRLLAPLRHERVAPKIDMILRDFPSKTFVSVPVSRANHDELQDLERYFLERGAQGVLFAPLSNRCSKTPAAFDSLAFAPQPGACRSDLAADLIVDWDGCVVLCCNDFAKAAEIGDLSKTSLSEVMNSPARRAMTQALDEGRWDDLATCSKCQFDTWQERTAVPA